MRRAVTRGLQLLLAAAFAGGPLAARAEAACSVGATGVSFGTYDVFSPVPNDSTGTITVRCDPQDKNVTIGIDGGIGGTVLTRHLRVGAEQLTYTLYLDAARTTIWGDGTSGTSVYSIKSPPPNRDTTLTIYGRIPAGQDVGVGAYSDTAVVIVNF